MSGAPPDDATGSARRPRGAAALAFSVAFWLFFAATASLGFALLCVAFAFTAPFDRDRRLPHAFLSRWGFAYLRLVPGWDVRVDGRERLPPGAAVFVANHQSAADVVVALGLRRQFKFVSKQSLFALPIVGWAMRLARYVRLHRARAKSVRRMLDECRGWLRRGVPVLIFPEGTYGLDGNLLPFKKGAFLLAVEQRVPLVPLLIEGTPTLIYDDGPLLSPRARVRLRVLPPIPADALGDDPIELARRVRALYAAALGVPARAAAPFAEPVDADAT